MMMILNFYHVTYVHLLIKEHEFSLFSNFSNITRIPLMMMTAMVVRNSNRSTLPRPSWPISVRGEGNGGWAWAGLRWRWFTIHDQWWPLFLRVMMMMIIVIVMISDDGFDDWWKVRKWRSTTRIWILIKQSFHPVHLSLFWFYLQLFRNHSIQKRHH